MTINKLKLKSKPKSELKLDINHFIVEPGKQIKLDDYDPVMTEPYLDKKMAADKLKKVVQQLAKLQNILYAENSYSVLIILQGMDTSGKDSVIRYVMSGVNPQGTSVSSFKEPSAEELDHDFLWRSTLAMPARGTIGIFNRSYYEEVIVARVHPKIVESQKIPKKLKDENFWKNRFEDINNFEKYVTRNGTIVLKFFLHVSKKEQKRRLLSRIDEPEKNWKFALSDVEERSFWPQYMHAYEDVLNHTSTKHAVWHIIPADNKWFSRAAIADIIVKKLKSLKLNYPVVSEEHQKQLAEGKKRLEAEND